jgi:hypothetical protein
MRKQIETVNVHGPIQIHLLVREPPTILSIGSKSKVEETPTLQDCQAEPHDP